MKNNTLLTNNADQKKRGFWMTTVGASLLMVAMMMCGSLGMVFALDTVMNIVVDIITKAALYIGIIITLWGVFQIILALRREDSEGISKQITTIVVGGALTALGALAPTIISALGG